MASTATNPSIVDSGFEFSRILEEHRRQDEKRRVKRAANRKSASTSRARKKAYVDDMTAKNERMKQHALVLSLLPDLVLAVCRTGEMTYVSPACQWLLLHSPEDMTGANIFELVAPECHPLLRKIISDNLSRPVKAALGGARDSSSAKSQKQRGLGGGSDPDESGDDEPHCHEEADSHRERMHPRCRQPQPGSCEGGATPAPSPSQSPERKMLRIFRGDKTTVWCESRLSVRNAKNYDMSSTAAPVPLEIILTLRTVEEGGRTAVAREFAGGQLSLANPSAADPNAGTNADEDADDDYVEADDDGYQCEVEAEEGSNNSGSGNDSGMRNRAKAKRPAPPSSRGFSRDRSGVAKLGGEVSRPPTLAAAVTATADPTVGREERSLSKKRQRVSITNRMEELGGGGSGSGGADKSGGDNSSTGGDTGGSTTHEGSGSCSNEIDSNGEGSNNESTSKWGDGDGAGSEDGAVSEEGTGTDFGEDVQTAVQSLILMGGDFHKASRASQ